MSRKWGWALVLPTMFGLHGSAADAGIFGCFKQDKCQCEPEQECCRPKRKCCLRPADPPRGEVAFTIPGVVRSGQAVPISDAAARRGIHEAAAREFRQSSRGLDEPSVEDRLDKLEKDVARLGEATSRLATVVENLDKKLNK